MNVVHLIGRVGQDPELRHASASSNSVVNLILATNEVWTKDGKRQERTEWHRLVFWGRPAEIVNQYVHRGDQLAVEGRLQTRNWTDREGIKRYTTEIVVLKLHLIGGRSNNNTQQQQEATVPDIPDEDIPF